MIEDVEHLTTWDEFRQSLGLQLASGDVVSAITFVMHRVDGEVQPLMGIGFKQPGDKPTLRDLKDTIEVLGHGSEYAISALANLYIQRLEALAEEHDG